MQRLFLLAFAAVVIIVIALMVLLYVSLIPHFGAIGDFASVALIIVLGCGVSLAVGFTFYTLKKMHNKSRVLTHGEVMVYLKPDGTFDVWSAIHEAAKAPQVPQVTVKELPSPSPDPRWDAVLDLRKSGKGMHAIAKELKVPYQRVRQFLNQVEGNDEEI
jgi:hypothetical protein